MATSVIVLKPGISSPVALVVKLTLVMGVPLKLAEDVDTPVTADGAVMLTGTDAHACWEEVATERSAVPDEGGLTMPFTITFTLLPPGIVNGTVSIIPPLSPSWGPVALLPTTCELVAPAVVSAITIALVVVLDGHQAPGSDNDTVPWLATSSSPLLVLKLTV